MSLLLSILIFFGFFLSGSLLSRIIKIEYEDYAHAFLFCTALGSVFASIVLTVLVFPGWVHPATAWLFLAGIYVAGFSKTIHILKTIPARYEIFRAWIVESTRWGFPAFNFCVLILLAFLSLTLALAPAYRTDALVYHLAVPKAFLAAQGLTNLPDNIYSFLPQQMDMLFLFALALGGGDSGAQGVGLDLAFLLLFALALYIKKFVSNQYSLFAPILFFSTPTFFAIAPAAYVDIGAAAYVFLSYYAWDIWRKKKHTGWFLLMSLFAASATATKLTTVIILPIMFLGIAWEGKRNNSKHTFTQLLAFAMVTTAILLPWWTRNLWYTGNPFAPYFMQFFGGTDNLNWDPQRSLLQHLHYSTFGMGRGVLDFFMLPYRLTFLSRSDSLRFDGETGILFFFLLPALLGLLNKRKFLPMVLTFLILLIFWFIHFQYIRLLAPAFSFLTVLSMAGLHTFLKSDHGNSSTPEAPDKMPWRLFGRNNLIPLALACGVAFNMTLVIKEWSRIGPIPYLAGIETRDSFLARIIPAYPMYQSINRNLGPNDKVLLVYMRNLGYLCNRPFISDTFFEAHTLKTMLQEDGSVEGLSTQMKSKGISHLAFNNRYVFGEDSALSSSEQKVLKNFLNQRARFVEREKEFYLYVF